MKRITLLGTVLFSFLITTFAISQAGDISDGSENNHLNGKASPPPPIPSPPPGSSNEGNNILVVWYEYDQSSQEYEIWFDKSTDKGQNWNTDVRVDSGDSEDERYDPSIASKIGTGGTMHVYVVWLDERNTSDREIFFSRSTDGGVNWSTDRCIASPNQVDNNVIEDAGIAVDHDNDDVIVLFRAGSELYYIHGTSPYGSGNWGNPVQLLSGSHGSVDNPFIHGTNGSDFGITWTEQISGNDRIRFTVIEYDSQEDEYSVSSSMTVSDGTSADYDYASLEYISPGGGYGAAWYATFWNTTDDDIYIDRASLPDSVWTWGTDQAIASSQLAETYPSIHGKRHQNAQDEWYDYIVVGYDKDDPTAGKKYDLKADCKGWDLQDEAWNHDESEILVTSDDDDYFFNQIFILNMGTKKVGAVYDFDDDTDEIIKWNTVYF
jgi:hypothetical protein